MCNNNGECRKHVAGVMCPSFRVTGNERDVTRGRANTLRLAISGQLGPDAFASDEMLETMKLCVSCKGCRRECPTGVDMAKMKIEVLAAANKRRGLSLRDRLVAYLPRYAPYASRLAPLMNARNAIPGARPPDRAPDRLLRQAPAPPLAPRLFPAPTSARPHPSPLRGEGGGESARFPPPTLPARGRGIRPLCGDVALFADTFNTYFEPENLHAAVEVLTHLGYRVTVLAGRRQASGALCCGRTFLSAGLVEEARAEARRMLAAARADARARRAGRRPGAVLSAHPARRVHRPCCPGPKPSGLACAAPCCSRSSSPPRPQPGASRGRSRRTRQRCCCTATATRRRSAPWRPFRPALALVEGLEVETVEIQLLRHGRRVRLWRGHARGVHGDGRAVAAAGGAQGRPRTP